MPTAGGIGAHALPAALLGGQDPETWRPAAELAGTPEWGPRVRA
ncbi:hypothetical protein ACIRG4_05175 [Streptomyces sp. NPDC102395]